MMFCGAMTKQVRRCKRSAKYICHGCDRALCYQHIHTTGPDPEDGFTYFYCWVCARDRDPTGQSERGA